MSRIWVVLVVVAMSSCFCGPSGPQPPGRVDGGCVEDSDCADPTFFFCDYRTSLCTPTCRSSAQCGAERPAKFAIPECDNPLGCWCDEGRCLVAQCSDDAQCSGALACRNGQCVAPPQASAVARCEIWPALTVTTAGAFNRFHVLSTDGSGEPVVVSAGASWEAMGPILGASQGHSVEVTAPATATANPVTAVRASFGSTSCEAQWLVLPSPAVGELLASVVEEGSGLPIPGALVVLSNPDGSFVEQQTTDALGVARLTATGPSSTLSVFHADFSFQTIANITGKTRTLFFSLKRNRVDRHGGLVGRFLDVPLSSNMRLARAGLSTSGDVLELTDETEPTLPTDIVIGSAVNAPDTAVPMGTFMRFGDQSLKSTVVAFGKSGQCADSALTASGSCSVQSAWALTGDIPLGDLPFDGSAGGFAIPSLMPVLLRSSFKGYSSTVLRDLDVRLRPPPLGPGGFPDLRDPTSFTSAPLPFSQLRLGFHFAVRPPAIPRNTRNSFMGEAITSAVAVVPGRGLVPIGVGIGINTSFPDSQFDRITDAFPAGVLALHMAPPHHGLEGQPTAMVIQLFDRREQTEGRETSAILARLPSSLPYDQKGLTPIDLSGQALPGVVDGQFRAGTRTFTADPIVDVSIVRVTFTDALETQWEVLVDPAAPIFTLPAVPGTLRDRIFRDGNGLSGEASQRRVSALRIADSRAFDEVIGENPAVRPPGDLTAWSHKDAVLPSVSFGSTPSVLPREGSFELKTFGFEVGRDGKVKVTFSNGNCVGAHFSSEPVRVTLNLNCQGQSIVIRAELLDRNDAPLDPPVSTSFTATIQ